MKIMIVELSNGEVVVAPAENMETVLHMPIVKNVSVDERKVKLIRKEKKGEDLILLAHRVVSKGYLILKYEEKDKEHVFFCMKHPNPFIYRLKVNRNYYFCVSGAGVIRNMHEKKVDEILRFYPSSFCEDSGKPVVLHTGAGSLERYFSRPELEEYFLQAVALLREKESTSSAKESSAKEQEVDAVVI